MSRDISTSIGSLSKPFNFFIPSLSQERGPLPSQDQGAEPSERMARKPSEPENRGSNPRGPAMPFRILALKLFVKNFIREISKDIQGR